MFTLVAVHVFPIYFPGNKLKHPSECTILKVIFKIDLRSHDIIVYTYCINILINHRCHKNLNYFA